MNLPNKLTLTRILLVPVFMIFASLTGLSGIADGSFQPTYYLIAGIVFAAASFTDFLDGHLARKWNMVTDFGKFADPLADKLLTTVAFIYMMRDGVCSPVVLCIILAREFAVSGLRMVAAGAKDGKVIAANMWGKVKTVLQMLSIIFYFFGMAIAANVSWDATVMVVGASVVLCWLVAAVTAISGIKYLWDNRTGSSTPQNKKNPLSQCLAALPAPPKGGALAKTEKFISVAKTSPFRRGGNASALTERVLLLRRYHEKIC